MNADWVCIDRHVDHGARVVSAQASKGMKRSRSREKTDAGKAGEEKERALEDSARGDESVPGFETFQRYAAYKAYDLLSDGSYRRLVVRSKENGDPWALQLYAAMQEVSNVVKRLQATVASLHEFGKRRLQMACAEAIASTGPPCRRRPGWNVCMITGMRSDDCVDIARACKSDSTVVVNSRFAHFLVMLWFVVKIEVVCKTVAKRWLREQGPVFEEATPVRDICRAFSDDGARMRALYDAFVYALGHVTRSIEEYKHSFGFTLLAESDVPVPSHPQAGASSKRARGVTAAPGPRCFA